MLPKVVREAACETARRGRSVPCPYDRHALAIDQVEFAPGDQQRRRVLQLGKQRRVKPLPQRQEPGAELLDSRDLALSFGGSSNCRRLPSTASCEIGHRRKRGRGRPETHDQLAESDRTDARRAQQPQTVD